MMSSLAASDAVSSLQIEASTNQEPDEVIRFVIQSNLVGSGKRNLFLLRLTYLSHLVIGRAGSTAEQIRTECRVYFAVLKSDGPNLVPQNPANDRIIVLYGSTEGITSATQMLSSMYVLHSLPLWLSVGPFFGQFSLLLCNSASILLITLI